MIKLKNILKEGFAWERKADGSLPTIADTTTAYEAKMREQAELNMPDMDDGDEVDEAAKPDYIDADGDGNEKESMKKAFADKEKMAEGSESNLSEYSDDALRDMKINLSRFEGNEEEIKDINREIKRRKNKKETNESALIKKSGLQEMREIPLEQRILRNLKGNDYILRETFHMHEDDDQNNNGYPDSSETFRDPKVRLVPNPEVSKKEYLENIAYWTAQAQDLEKFKIRLQGRLKRAKNPIVIEDLEGEIDFVQQQIDLYYSMVKDRQKVMRKIK